MSDIARLSTCAHFLKPFLEQLPVLVIEGSHCASLRKLYKYLRRVREQKSPHVHARLYLEEVVGVDALLCPATTRTLLLQPAVLNWNPYAIFREVAWLRNFVVLEHLELSLNGDGAREFVQVLRDSLPALQALAVSTNEACRDLWPSLTSQPRPHLRILCVNGFRLEPVSLRNIGNLRFLWINRPCTRRGTAAFMRRVSENVHGLLYLTTRDFAGFDNPAALGDWLASFQGSALPRLKYWETDGCDIHDTATVVRLLGRRLHPLTVQGLRMNDASIHVPPGHRLLSRTNRDVPLHLHRIYRSLEALDYLVHTRIPTAGGLTILRGSLL